MGYEYQTVTSLSSAEYAEWEAIRSSSKLLANPFFSSNYYKKLTKYLPVKFLLTYESSKLQAILPYEEPIAQVAVTPGWPSPDYHGLICRDDFDCDLTQMLRAVGLRFAFFDRIRAEQAVLARYQCGEQSSSLLIDFSNLSNDYFSTLSKNTRKDLRHRARLFEKQFGCLPVFTIKPDNSGLIEKLLAWKAAHVVQTTLLQDLFESPPTDRFDVLPWWRHFLKDLVDSEGAALIACLELKGQPLVIDYVLTSDTVWHSYCCSFDRSLSQFGVGNQEILEVVNFAAANKIRQLDFGGGDEWYKTKFTNTVIPLIHVAVCSDPTADLEEMSLLAALGLEKSMGLRLNSNVRNQMNESVLGGLRKHAGVL